MIKIIKLTRLDDSEIVINAELIELVEATPDTVISLTSNRRMVVKEDVETVIDKVLKYKRKTNLRRIE